MATGYTTGIGEGKIKNFKDFALTCARAFGACIMQKEDSFLEPPKLEEVKDFYPFMIEEVERQIQVLKDTSDQDLIAKYIEEKDKSYKENVASIQEKNKLREKYEKILNDAKNWDVDGDFQGLKNFMIQQLTDSIEWDCSTKYNDESITEYFSSTAITADEIRAEKMDRLERDLVRYNEKYAEDVKDVNVRNEWKIKLFNKLKE